MAKKDEIPMDSPNKPAEQPEVPSREAVEQLEAEQAKKSNKK